MSSPQPNIAIIGAGIAGLVCARRLHDAGQSFTIYESSHAVGGRVRTDVVDGFRLDRGFQTFLPAYPAAKKLLDYDDLHLKPFYRGAMVYWAGQMQRLADPLHHPSDAFRSLKDKVVPWRDKWLSILLRKHLFGMNEIPRHLPEQTTEDFLREWGFSDVFVDHFMRAFFGGVFLDRELVTSSLFFQFIFSMFDRGGSAVPAKGMQAIPDQLARPLPPGCIRFNQRVTSVRPGELTLDSGEVLHPEYIIMAAGEENAVALLPDAFQPKPPPMRASTTLYFASDKPVSPEPVIFLDGDLVGPVNHACVMSSVSRDYAPPGQHLIATSVMGSPSSAQLVEVVREQMRSWYGNTVDHWRHLRTYLIRHAQSDVRMRSVGTPLPIKVAKGIFRCGDYCEDVSLNGAMISGRKTAKAVLEEIEARQSSPVTP